MSRRRKGSFLRVVTMVIVAILGVTAGYAPEALPYVAAVIGIGIVAFCIWWFKK